MKLTAIYDMNKSNNVLKLSTLGFRWLQGLMHNLLPSWVRHVYNIVKA
jgi:hypothetical protein